MTTIPVKGIRITKDGKLAKAKPKLSRPAAYAAAKRTKIVPGRRPKS